MIDCPVKVSTKAPATVKKVKNALDQRLIMA